MIYGKGGFTQADNVRALVSVVINQGLPIQHGMDSRGIGIANMVRRGDIPQRTIT